MVRRQRRAMESKVKAWATENGPKMREDVTARVLAQKKALQLGIVLQWCAGALFVFALAFVYHWVTR